MSASFGGSVRQQCFADSSALRFPVQVPALLQRVMLASGCADKIMPGRARTCFGSCAALTPGSIRSSTGPVTSVRRLSRGVRPTRARRSASRQGTVSYRKCPLYHAPIEGDELCCGVSKTTPIASHVATRLLRSIFTGVSTTLTATLLSACLFSAPAQAALISGPGMGAGALWTENAELASISEDGLLELVKQIEATVDGTVQNVTGALQVFPDGPSQKEDKTLAQELVQEVWEVVDQNFLDARNAGFSRERWLELRDEELAKPTLQDRASAHRAIKTMLARGLSDPYTRFVSPKEFESMRKYDLSGVGLNLGTGEEYMRKLQSELPQRRSPTQSGVWVLGIIKGTAADSAGLSQGDEILSVDSQSAVGKTPFEVSSAIQGDMDSPQTVCLEVMQAQTGEIQQFCLRRPGRQAAPSPVKMRLETEGRQNVGYITLTSFNARAQADVSQAVRSLAAAGADELVLDLRDNRGGLVTSGVEVARLFLDDGSIVVVTQGAKRDDQVVARGSPLTSLPLTVLVNEHTASASEILAGALRDNCRSTLVGRTTYGKGLIQSVYELSDESGIVITVGKYRTPSGTDIDRNGIHPDFQRIPSREKRQALLDACLLGQLHN